MKRPLPKRITPRTSTSSSLPEGIVPLVDLRDDSEDDDLFATPAIATPGPATSTPTA